MKYFVLTDEEQQILEDFENGKLVSIPNLEEEKKRFQKIAKDSLNKNKNINIRLSEKDVYKLKAKAIEAGIPYQTLASSILHRFANNDTAMEL